MSQIRPDLRPYFKLLGRRWTVIVPAIVLVPLIALLLASGAQNVYSATAQVLLTYSSPGASLNGLANAYPGISPTRNVATQAALARNPGVAQEALTLSHVDSTPTQLLANSSVSSPNGSDLLNFSVNASAPARARTLATDYARAYVAYRGSIDSQAISTALAGITAQMSQLARAGATGSPTYRTLSRNQQALIATQASGTDDAVLAQPAQNAVRTGPHPGRSAAIGLALGILLAIVLAIVMETFDQRITTNEAGRRLRLPLLASIPVTPWWRRRLQEAIDLATPPSEAGGADELAVLRRPGSREARAFRVLTSRLEFARLERDFKSLLFTSTRHDQSIPESVANLATTLAEAGRSVLLCDLTGPDRALGDVFHLGERQGVTEVALRYLPLEEAIVPITRPPAPWPAPSGGGPASNEKDLPASDGATTTRDDEEAWSRVRVGREQGGSLDVLPAGAPPPRSELFSMPAVSDLMEQLRLAPYDLVLIAAPPLLGSCDAHTLSALADAVVIALPGPIRPQTLSDLTATLSGLPMLALGFITIGRVPVHGRRGEAPVRAADHDLTEPALISNGAPERPPGASTRRAERSGVSARYLDELQDR